MKEKNILIILNAVVYNRGSEALVRGLTDICKMWNEDCKIYISSSEAEIKDKFSLPKIEGVICRYKNEISFMDRVFNKACKVINSSQLYYKHRCKDLITFAKKMDVIIVVGADNYDQSYRMFDMLHSLNSILRKETEAELILYDCSLEEKHINKEIIDDMNLFDFITVRESITFNNFKGIFDENKLFYFPDPAFIMKLEEVKLPITENISDNYVGINLSNLILNEKYGSDSDKVLNSYYRLIEYILKESQMKVLLIPHVMKGADLSILKILYDKYKIEYKDRIVLIDDENLNAAQLKHIISKCSLFVGARTHSTIAAYSSCIPTLVLGYSVKSLGIATDIFGTYENYVLPVAALKDENDLVESFKWIEKNSEEIRNHLTSFMPEYKKKVENTKTLFDKK